MDESTLIALQGSIKKWETIVSGDAIDMGSDNCPLCQKFMALEAVEPDWATDGCFGCPVAEKVGMSLCSRTPYEKWADYVWTHREDGAGVRSDSKREWHYQVFDDRSKELAQKEADFLRSLLPSLPQPSPDK